MDEQKRMPERREGADRRQAHDPAYTGPERRVGPRRTEPKP